MTYPYNSMDDDFTSEGEELEKCSACGFIFFTDDGLDEDVYDDDSRSEQLHGDDSK